MAAGEREKFLQDECGDDGTLFQEVLGLASERRRPADFLEWEPSPPATDSAPAQPRIPSGHILANRFEVLRFLGRGGMGEVYEAIDKELGEPVAVKVLRDDLPPDSGFLERFRREIRLARRITHPNVCRLFDFDRDEYNGTAVYFYVMEMLPGENLAARLGRAGPMSADECLAFAHQMADGLRAAHLAGIVHRDFKPANVMIVPSDAGPRVVITDFGLAVAIPRDSSGRQTTTSTILGTPGYIAPEQWYGGPISAATDIYAFGIVLHEMRTGMPPGARADPGFPSLSFAWRNVIDRCIQMDPTTRFATADELLRALEDLGAERWITRRRLLLASLGAAGIGTMSLSGWFLRHSLWRPQIQPGATVLVAELVNDTGDPTLNGVTELMRSQLGQSTLLNIVDGQRVRATLRQMGKGLDEQVGPDVVREVAWRLQSTLVVFGTASRIGPDYVLTIQLETRGGQPQAPAARQIRPFSARNRAGLMEAVRESASWIRHVSGEAAASMSQFDRLPEDVTTPDWEAFSYFAKAERLAQEQQANNAILMLDTALDRDPGFTLASMRRGDLLMSLSRQREGLLQWREAIRLLGKRPVTRREELRVKGMFAYDAGDYRAADRAFAQWALEYPADPRGFFYRTIPLLLEGHAAEAVRNLQRAAQLDSGYASTYAQLCNCYIALGNYDEALGTVARLRKLGEVERPLYKEAVIQICRGNFDTALDLFGNGTLTRSPNEIWRLRSVVYRAMVLADASGYESAIRILEPAVREPVGTAGDIDRSSQLLALAWMLAATGEKTRIPDLMARALDLESGPPALAHAGTLLARCGHRDAATRLLTSCEGLLDFPKYRLVSRRISGELALAEGDRVRARQEFEGASSLEPRLAFRSYLARYLRLSGDTVGAGRLEAQTILCPWLAWLHPMTEMPGAWGEAVRNRASGTPDPAVEKYATGLAKVQKL